MDFQRKSFIIIKEKTKQNEIEQIKYSLNMEERCSTS